MTSRERFLAACDCRPLPRPPLWVMRQAGRYLPEYRALKEKYSFVEMVKTPDLAVEVTMQPLQRFDLDAGILFSDILVIPEALGQPYYFRDKGGIGMEWTIESSADVDRLENVGAADRLDYVYQTLKLLRQEIPDRALLGFGGSPWTLATYMVEGGSSKDFSKIKALYFSEPATFRKLMKMLTDTLVEYFRRQIEAGADAIQIFDSWASLCPADHYEQMSLRWIREIIARLPADFPIILYAKGMLHLHPQLTKTGASVLGVDWSMSLSELRREVSPTVALQGNMDPVVMTLTPEVVRAEATNILEQMAGLPGHIFNLGHGITPDAKPENMETLVETVKNFG